MSNVWLIYLEGGQWCAHAARGLTRAARRSAEACPNAAAPRGRCYNNATCYARAQGAATLASSKNWDKAVRVRSRVVWPPDRARAGRAACRAR